MALNICMSTDVRQHSCTIRVEELKAKREAEESARKEHAAALAVRKAACTGGLVKWIDGDRT